MEGNNTEKPARVLVEEKILEFWNQNKIFEKTLEKEAPMGDFVFFEGPPTANGRPGIHHLEARAFKDAIPRYKTMQGYFVRRKGGWDTHGLPVELQVEKALGLKSKKEIESYGIAAFNKQCKDSIHQYLKLWSEFTYRIGYWVDQKNAYFTYHNSYIESVWNIVSKINDKGLLYKDYKIVPWCARCGTGLSSHELAQGYEDVKDLSVYAKFKIIGTDNGYFVAWTTTPWTLPGNVALAVGKDIAYVEVECTKKFPVALKSLDSNIFPAGNKIEKEILVLAKERYELLKTAFDETYPAHKIIAEHTGAEMVDMQYEPLYGYQKTEGKKKDVSFENAFKVYAADFVTTTDGTGIVHIAPMYGADDFDLGTKNKLPKFHIVDEAGHFIKGTDFLENRFVKDEDVAIDIIKDLAHRGLLFKKEKFEHSYPHCWRCKTPLIYYARDSWYIQMSALRDKLVENNKNINWEPAHTKDGRFGEWIKEVKDWAISRERYWGTPLPIWVSADNDIFIPDSVDALKKYIPKAQNNYFVMRHGETPHNVTGVWNLDRYMLDPLTENGLQIVKENAQFLKDKKIDLIISSPFPRTIQTSEIVADVLGIHKDKIVTDDRLVEWNPGKSLDSKSVEEFFKLRNESEDRYEYKFEDGESYKDILIRSGEFLYDIEKKYVGKNILIVSHGAVTRSLSLVGKGFSFQNLYSQTRSFFNFVNAEIRPLDFIPLPHNENFELDLHRPYIDEILLTIEGKKYTRTKEVMDVWFDSGAMPFAQDHYPFENKEYIDTVGFPADFISEAVDQTRGWFYTLHAVGALMGKGPAYKNVICLGLILDSQGKKMSKSIGNIVEPLIQVDKYGADAIRLWMYSVNQPGDSKNYDEKTVDELVKKVFNLFGNVLSFYELYRDQSLEKNIYTPSSNILDQWIVTRLNETIIRATEYLDTYKLFEASRLFRDVIDDLSTWYVRRSRDRIKDGDQEAKQTLYFVMKKLAQIMAPFTPFFAENIWQKLKLNEDSISIHLSAWPLGEIPNNDSIDDMERTRTLCTTGNALRKKLNIPVRQPLSSLKVKSLKLSIEYLKLIEDELNIKDVVEDVTLIDEIELDTYITPELKKEGEYRELVRSVQDLRKEIGLLPSDVITLILPTKLFEKIIQIEDFKKTIQAKEVIVDATIDHISIKK